MLAVVDGEAWPNCFCTMRRLPVFRRLLSRSHVRKNGMEIQVVVAKIVCMLIVLGTGRQSGLGTVEMMGFRAAGWADRDGGRVGKSSA